MGPRRGQFVQEVLGFRRRRQELEAETAGSAGGGSEPRAAMKKYELEAVVPRRVRADGTTRPDEWVCMCSAANFLDSGTCRRCGPGPSPVQRAAGAGEYQRVRHMPGAGRSVARQSGDRYDCHRGRSAFQGKAEGARGHGTDNEGAPGHIARSTAHSNDWTDPGETSGSSAARSRAGLGIGERGGSQGGGSERAKRSPSSAGEGREGQDQAADRDRGSQRGRAQIAAGKGTQRTRGGGRNAASARRPCGARGHQRTGREAACTARKASRRPAKVCTREFEIQVALTTIGGHIHNERRVYLEGTPTMLDLREFHVEAEKRKTVPCSPSRDGRETDALGHRESMDN